MHGILTFHYWALTSVCTMAVTWSLQGQGSTIFFVFFVFETKREVSTVALGSLLEVYKLSTYLDIISNLYMVLMIHDRVWLPHNSLVVHPIFVPNVKLKYCGIVSQVKAHYFQYTEVVLHFKIVCSTLNHLFCVAFQWDALDLWFKSYEGIFNREHEAVTVLMRAQPWRRFQRQPNGHSVPWASGSGTVNEHLRPATRPFLLTLYQTKSDFLGAEMADAGRAQRSDLGGHPWRHIDADITRQFVDAGRRWNSPGRTMDSASGAHVSHTTPSAVVASTAGRQFWQCWHARRQDLRAAVRQHGQRFRCIQSIMEYFLKF
jgi:hypothetical protein